MKFKFIANACGIFTSSSGKTILCDPWIEDGVFDGSWCHFHKLETKIKDLKNELKLSNRHASLMEKVSSELNKNIYDIRVFNKKREVELSLLFEQLHLDQT